MKKDNPWLFQRMVRIGFVPPTMPVYVFSPEASEQVAQINASSKQETLSELSPYPHDVFAVEMSCKVYGFDQKMRTLTIVSVLLESLKMSLFGSDAPPEVIRQIVEVETFNGGTTIHPPVFSLKQGTFAALTDSPVGVSIVNEAYDDLKNVLISRCSDKLAEKYKIRRFDTNAPDFNHNYKERSGETVAFLNSACAVLASPVINSESGKLSGRAPPLPGGRKGVERQIETKWTYVDIDLDRHARNPSNDNDEGRSGVALHPVRSHLRVTRHGISQVRAHMRGDPAYGVRHRVGQVHRTGR